MKFLFVMMTGTLILAGSAYAQQGGAPIAAEHPAATGNTVGAAPAPNVPRPSGEPRAPNQPRAAGETTGGHVVNPDRVPPLSPGGQGNTAGN